MAEQTAKQKKIYDEAVKRFKRCQDWESDARSNWIKDTKFANADPTNRWQWPDDILQGRDDDRKPTLTINMVRQHNLQIINSIKKNRPGISVKPTGGEATFEAAMGVRALLNHIQYRSQAANAYDKALEGQVEAGLGYFRICTDYVDNKSFNQEILIKQIDNPLTVYMDPDARDVAKADKRFCFVFEDLARDLAKAKYSQYEEYFSQTTLGNTYNDWCNTDKVRIAEYWRKLDDEEWLYARENGQMWLESELIKLGTLNDIKNEAGIRKRKVPKNRVECITIVGHHVVSIEEWPGKYIPIIPVTGEERIIDNKLDRKGHTRALMDTQRMYNYWSSAGVEFGALQTKTPWTAPVEAIDGYETFWNNANRDNFALLPYRSLTDSGDTIPPPQRIEPPVASPVAITGMQIARTEMMIASGQYESQMGQTDNARTGIAIAERQRQGDTSTYHFADNLAKSITHAGQIMLDLIPKIYDTQRVLQVLAPDGSPFELELAPASKDPVKQQMDAKTGRMVKLVLNPALGEFDVESDIGPAYSTLREEAFEAFKLILTQSPELVNVIGDILFKAGDFPLADEAAERLRRMVPPQALGQGPSPQEQALLAENTNLKSLLQRSLEEIAMTQVSNANKLREQRIEAFRAINENQVDRFKAFTDRLKVIVDKQASEETAEAQPDIKRVVAEALLEMFTMSEPVGNPAGGGGDVT